MHARNRILLSGLAFLCCALLAPLRAQAVVINAADYAVGADLTDAFPGAILQYATYNGDGHPGFTTSPLIIGTDTYFTDDGDAQFDTFGETDSGGDEGPLPLFGTFTYAWHAIYVAFTVPVYSVSFAGYNEGADPTAIVAYGQQTVIGNGGGPFSSVCESSAYAACLNFPQGTVTSTTPISYVLLGGLSSSTYITELDIPGLQVPEPSSLAIFGGALLALMIIASRRARPARAVRL